MALMPNMLQYCSSLNSYDTFIILNKLLICMSQIEKFSDFIDSLIGKELRSYQKINEFQKYFDDIAKYIFGNVAVVIGDSNSKQINYYLEEIEFYYNNDKISEEEFTFTTKKGEEKKVRRIISLVRINVKEMQNSYFGIIVV
ncbi:MAG: hypothetical protein IIT65_04770 [Lachnospiraceae bacterium]|nr:hypothetical protein [Lachnospiraceae bacterium]